MILTVLGVVALGLGLTILIDFVSSLISDVLDLFK